jgi:hypothetical protein
MGNRRRDAPQDAAHDADTLVVELLDEGMPADVDVDLGGGSSSSGWRSFGVLAAVLTVAIAVILGVTVFGRDDRAAPVVATTVPVTTAPAPSTTVADVVPAAPAPPPGPSSYRLAPVPLLDSDLPLSLYLRTSDGSALYAVDVSTGWATPVEGTVGLVAKLLPGAGGPVVVDQRRSAQDPFSWATGPSGAVWRPSAAGTSLELVQIADGQEVLVTTVTIGPQERLIGSTALGEPVISGPDARQYVAAAGGQRSKIAEGLVSFVEAGNFVELSCDDAQLCVILAHDAAGNPPLRLAYHRGRAYRFSPDGTRLALLEEDGLRVVDMASGSDVVGVAGPVFAPQRVDAPAAVTWSPDGRYVLASTTDGRLIVVDLSTNDVQESALPGDLALAVPLALL